LRFRIHNTISSSAIISARKAAGGTSDLIEDTDVTQRILSISGLRGIVGDGLEPAYLVEFASAFGTLVSGGTVVVSRDGRSTGAMVQHAVFASLLAAGCRVLDAGIASTPTLGVLVQAQQAAGGLQITASHNPAPWNGLKPFSSQGAVFDAVQGELLLELLEGRQFRHVEWNEIGHIETMHDPGRVHLERVWNLVDVAAIRKKRFQVVLDCNHGSGAILGPRLLEHFACDLLVLGSRPDGNFEHVPEPTRENLVDVCNIVKRTGAAVGFAQDPDADRLAIIDENGTYIGEELTLALCADYVLSRTPGPVVVNGSTSRVTADIAAKYGCEFHRSHVGEANVVAKMKSVQARLGGEGNGGLIEPQVGYVRDSFAAMAYVLAGLAARGGTLSQWVAELPRYTIVKDKLTCPRDRVTQACAALQNRFPDARAETGDGLRLDWADRWVQVRASNTEPILRVISEAPDETIARDLCSEAMTVVRQAVS